MKTATPSPELLHISTNTLPPDPLHNMNAYWRAALVHDVVDRLPDLGSKGAYLKQQMEDELIEHKHYIDKHGEDLPEI
jgi:xylulose-5-phosphate/fructose-6-phosphate phosphoketolase